MNRRLMYFNRKLTRLNCMSLYLKNCNFTFNFTNRIMTRTIFKVLLLLFLNSIFTVQGQISVSDSLEKVIKKNLPDSIKLNIYLQLAQINLSVNIEKANTYSKKALILSSYLHDTLGMMKAYNCIGVALSDMGNQPLALDFYFKSLELAKIKNRERGIASIYNNIAEIFNKNKDYIQALKYYNKSFEIENKRKDNEGIANYYNNIGAVYYKLGNINLAKKNYYNALSIYKMDNNIFGMAVIFLNIGIMFNDREIQDSAFFYFNKSLTSFEQINNIEGIANVCNSLGNYYSQNNQFQESIIYYKKSYDYANKIGNIVSVKAAAEGLCKIYEKLKDYKNAFQYLLIFKQMNDSLFNQESVKKLTKIEMQNEFDLISKQQEFQKKQSETKYQSELQIQSIIRNLIIGALILTLIFVFILLKNYREKLRKNKRLQLQNTIISQQKEEITAEKWKADKLISEILPSEASIEIINKGKATSEHYEMISSIFSKLQEENMNIHLESLKTELSPHFLFNSFSTLIGVIEENQAIASKYAQELSNIFKYVLQCRHKDIIELSEEILFIESFSFLQSKRYGSNLKFEIDLSNNYLNYYIPALSLQILVENAIKHNIISEKKPLTINIFVEENVTTKTLAYLVVKNNLQEKTTLVSSTKIGLSNIKDRYRFYTDSKVNIIKNQNEFIVKIPLLEI